MSGTPKRKRRRKGDGEAAGAGTGGPLLGAHLSVAGGLHRAFDHGAELGCLAGQIFVKSPNRWAGGELAGDAAATFREARDASPVGPLVAHAAYLINLAAPDEGVLARSREGLLDELLRCWVLGVDGLVVHPGSHKGEGEADGLARIVESVREVWGRLPERLPAGLAAGVPEGSPPPRLLFENTAGQGSALGWRLEHLEALLAGLEPLDDSGAGRRFGVCLDTCHAFAAGYPVHEEAGYEAFWAEVDERIGLARVDCLHLNDSLRPFASRRDRHAHIGDGEIGLAAFERLVNDPRLARVPMVLETEPGEEREGHRRDLETLRGLVRPG